MYAAVYSVLSWLKYFPNTRICLFVDNDAVKTMLNDYSSGCKNCMTLVRIFVLETLKWNTRVFAKWVKSEHNSFADALSRLQFGRFDYLANKSERIFNEKYSVPEELADVNKLWIDKV